MFVELSQRILSRGPVGFWPCNDPGSPAAVWDLSGNGSTGTPTNTPAFRGYPFLDGTAVLHNTLVSGNPYTQLSNPSILDLRNTWTAYAWATTANAGAGERYIIAEKFNGGSSAVHYQLGINVSGATTGLGVGFFDVTHRTAVTGVAPVANVWYFMVGTYDGTTLKYYQNGALVTANAASPMATPNYNGVDIGARLDSGSPGHHWDGAACLIALYNYPLDQKEIAGDWAFAMSCPRQVRLLGR